MKKLAIDNLNQSLKDKITNSKVFFEKVEAYIQIILFEDKEYIIKFDQVVDTLYFVIEGKAKVTMIHEDGKRSIISFLKPLAFIGELSLIGVDHEPKDIEAISDCICIALPLDKAKELLLTDCNFLLKLNQYIGQKLLARTWFQMKFQNYELKNRLAAYMLMSENNGIYQEKHTETAEFLNVSYRHLLHTFKQFTDQGIITKQKKHFVVDIKALKALSLDILSFYK